MNHEAAPPFELPPYFERIGYKGAIASTFAVLEKLHLGHASHIPFENLDILLGRPIKLDLVHLQEKLVRCRRGGYCFEHNTLFAAALEACGFAVTKLAARVRWGTMRLLPRTHMLLKVEADGSSWLVDVGFGGEGLLKPVPLISGNSVNHYGRENRVVAEKDLWVLQSRQNEDWHDLYAFTLEPHFDVDFEMANHFTSTHPTSRFVQMLTVQLPTPEARYILRGREFTILRGDHSESRFIADDDELLRVLSDTFGLHFPSGTRFLETKAPHFNQ